MATRGRRQLGSYLPITPDFQRDVREALAAKGITQKELARLIKVDASSISLLLAEDNQGKTSRIIGRVAAELKLPLPTTETDEDAKKLARIKAGNPRTYKLIHDLINEMFDKID